MMKKKKFWTIYSEHVCKRIVAIRCQFHCTSEQAGLGQVLAQLLQELYLFAPELVAGVVTNPAVMKRVSVSPLLLEALRFFFQA
jgi:hypothetical protein